MLQRKLLDEKMYKTVLNELLLELMGNQLLIINTLITKNTIIIMLKQEIVTVIPILNWKSVSILLL